MTASNDKDELKKAALEYHSQGRPGKIEIGITKPCGNQRELSLAYTPGVAEPCLEIKKDPSKVFDYTARGNLVGVVTNGTAVLGLGNIGPLAGKPVMEGKSVLFKKFADVDAFDIEINENDPAKLIEIVKSLEPTFGGINLEDIKAPECFQIEQTLIKEMKIPVFHDDQHGTAIIGGAALLNALEVVGKDIRKIKIVFSGAGAAAVACAKMFNALGALSDNIFMCDKFGLVTCERDDFEPNRAEFCKRGKPTSLKENISDADVLMGLSVGGVVDREMIGLMAKEPVIFAMANPTPEIFPEEVLTANSDAIVATGRSDYPNQVNNVLGFPFIFRGALDVSATCINEQMKKAAAYALAKLAKEPVPDGVLRAYGVKELKFGKQYLIPKPLDPRVLTCVAPAVAKAAMESGVARRKIEDFAAYERELVKRISK
jgi:malate dehydrogenase (oxaloacetate-decarboxylating)(NADP+)